MPKDPNAWRNRSLMEDAEHLAKTIVRDANKKQKTADGKFVPRDISERAKALETAIRFLQVKNKIAPEEAESEFERGLQSYHSQRGGGPDDDEDSRNGAGTTH